MPEWFMEYTGTLIFTTKLSYNVHRIYCVIKMREFNSLCANFKGTVSQDGDLGRVHGAVV
jgi:hypothetical protein